MMPKTKLQDFIFTLMMAFVMVYAMVCYNIAMDMGGMTNQVFLLAFHEMPIMWPIAVILEFFIVGKLAPALVFRFMTPQDKPLFITCAISSMIVCIMCPVMSFIATVLFKGVNSQLIAVWLQTTVINFPMALCWQIFFAGPAVRNIFGFFMRRIETSRAARAAVEN